MRLLHPIELDDARTEDVGLTPTKKFFKPVIVLSAPLTRANAAILGCAWMLDENGNPNDFEGSVRIPGELSGAEITFSGKVTKPVTIKTEKIAHFSCWREEKTGMRIQLRAHMPEDKEKLYETLDFLALLNKEQFAVTVVDQQGSLLAGPARPDAEGIYEWELAEQKPFTYRSGRTVYAVRGELVMLRTEDGHVSGWRCNATGIKTETGVDNKIGGRVMSVQSPIYQTAAGAWKGAAMELRDFLLELAASIDGSGSTNEKQAVQAALDFCGGHIVQEEGARV